MQCPLCGQYRPTSQNENYHCSVCSAEITTDSTAKNASKVKLSYASLLDKLKGLASRRKIPEAMALLNKLELKLPSLSSQVGDRNNYKVLEAARKSFIEWLSER